MGHAVHCLQEKLTDMPSGLRDRSVTQSSAIMFTMMWPPHWVVTLGIVITIGGVTLPVCCLQSDLPLDEQMSFASIQSADSLTSLDRVCVVCSAVCVCACVRACVHACVRVQYVCACMHVHVCVTHVDCVYYFVHNQKGRC